MQTLAAMAASTFCTGTRPDIPTRQKPCSDEGERQQAGAEQGHSTRSQGQEAIGNEISIAHDTPSDLNARPNCLRLSERATSIESDKRDPPRSNPRADPLKRMCEENSGADQSHHCCHRLEHRKRPLRPSHAQKTVAALHSQKDSGWAKYNGLRPRILCNRCSKRSHQNAV